jgi:sn-glycerol 3-phosphate transport system substrate-binding protein
MTRPHPLLGVLCATALVLAACGGGDDGDTSGTMPGSEPSATSPTDTAGTGTAPVDTEPPVDLPPCPLEALDEADGPVEVVVWHTQVAEPLDALTALVERYNSSQDRVRVRLESQGSAYGELKRKFQATLQTPGDLPALIMFDDTATQEMADSGYVLPAQSCFDAAGVDLGQFSSVATSYYTIDGVMWPVSANLGGILLYYNRDHFEAAGLDPDDPPQTLAEVRAAAEAIAAAGVAERPVAHELSSWKTEFWLTGAGSSIVDNDNGRGPGETTAATLSDNPEALELFTWFDDMQEDGLLEPIPSTDGQIDQYLALATQRSSMLIESSSAATSVEAFLGGELDPDVLGGTAPSPSGLDIGASGFPGLVPGNQTQMGGAAWYLLNTTSPEVQAAAFDFMMFMNSPEAQLEMLTVGSYLPWLTEIVDDPAAIEFFDASLSGRWLEIAARQIDAIDPDFPGPLIGPYDPDVREAIERAQDALLLGDATPQEALDQAQAEIDDLLEQYASF